ncbi:MAG: hypothetical protein JSV86_20860 [Gemmatimonadota bacterium]|nr:MAG: hypothetical protein JSV86_20860 [Gemmatimonadota bacterium]
MRVSNAVGYGCFVVFLTPFCAVGIFAAFKALQAAFAAEWGDAGLFLIFALAFGGVGFALLAALIHGRKKQRELDRRQEEHPSEPWLWRSDWAAGRIEESSRRTMFAAWAFAGFWNLIAYPASIAAILQGYFEEGQRAALLALAFPLAGAGLLIWAIRATVRYRKFGISVFRMAGVPGVIGRKLEGVVLTNTQVRPDDGFHITLTCVNRITTGSGKSRSTKEMTLWQDERTLRHVGHVGGRATAIPVLFRLPPDARQTDNADPNNEVVWRLEARATVPGVDYDARFDVPVYRTPESDIPLPSEEEEALDSLVREYRQPPDSRIVVTQHVRRTEIYFAPARNPGAATGVTIFFLIWTAITVALPRLGAPIIFPIVFGLFDVLLFIAVFQLWLGSTRVVLTHGAARISHSPLARTRTISADDIDDVTLKIGMQAGNRPYYDIQIVRSDGKKLYAGRSIRDKREAEWLVERMKEALGL